MGTPVYVTLLVAAIAGVVALSVGWFARITARDIAALTANQKRQDVRIKALGAYVDLLMSAAAATQAYVWYADPEFVRTKEITQENWDSARELFQPAYEAYSKVKYLGTALADESLRDTYDRFVTALHSVIFAKESVKDAWHRIVRGEGQARLHRRSDHRRQRPLQQSVSRLSDRSAQLDHEAWDEEGHPSAPFQATVTRHRLGVECQEHGE